MSKSIRILFCVLLLTAVPVWGQVPLTTLGPAITSIVPATAPAGAPSVLLTVYGKNFVSGNATITWNGIALPTNFVSSGKLYTTVPGGYLTVAGTVKIAVAARLGSTPAVPFTITSATQSEMNSTTSSTTQNTTNSTTSSTTQSDMNSFTSSTAFALAPSLPNGTVGTTYRAALVKGGTPPYAIGLQSGALPAGITFDGASGYLVGAPKLAAAYAFIAAVKDSAGHSGSNKYAVSVGTASMTNTTDSPIQSTNTNDSISQSTAMLRITTTALPGANVGSAYSATLAATGGKPPYSWRIAGGSLPPGLMLNGSTGAITGTPTIAGSGSFIAEVKDASLATATYTYSVTISMSTVVSIPK